MFVEGKSRTVFFTSDTLIYGISRDGSKNYNIRTCEHMIQCQLRMGPRATIYAALAGGNANGGEKKESAHLRCIADTHRPVMHGRVQHGVIPITGSSDFHSFSNFFHIWITCNSF